MFYITTGSTGAPQITLSSQKNFAMLLKAILIDGLPSMRPDAINGNKITFNNGFKFREELSVFVITDGIKRIYSRLKILSINEFMIVEDISSLNQNSIILEHPKPSGWEYLRDEDAGKSTFKNEFAEISFNDTGLIYEIRRGDISVNINIRGFSEYNNVYEVVYTNKDIIICFITSAQRHLICFCSSEDTTDYLKTGTTTGSDISTIGFITNEQTGTTPDFLPLDILQYKITSGSTTILKMTKFGVPASAFRFFSYAKVIVSDYGFNRFSLSNGKLYLTYRVNNNSGGYLFEFPVVCEVL